MLFKEVSKQQSKYANILTLEPFLLSEVTTLDNISTEKERTTGNACNAIWVLKTTESSCLTPIKKMPSML
jgi:hypothetical protein